MDVERLCNVHIPQWLASAGMDAGKIGTFYDDPVKTAYDTWCINKAYGLKSFSIDQGPVKTAERWAKFVLQGLKGALRSAPDGSLIESPSLVPSQTAPGERALEPAPVRQQV